MIWYFKYRYYKKHYGEKGAELINRVQGGDTVRVQFEKLNKPTFVNAESFSSFHYLLVRSNLYGEWELD